LIVTSADPIRPTLSQCGSVPCIGYMRSIAVQGTALDYLDGLFKPVIHTLST